MSDPIQPDHYRWHPSGIEAIEVTEHFSFCLGNAIKYIWRAGRKGETLEDLKKARYYVDREISRIEREAVTKPSPFGKEAAAFEREFHAKVELPMLAAMAERVDQMWDEAIEKAKKDK